MDPGRPVKGSRRLSGISAAAGRHSPLSNGLDEKLNFFPFVARLQSGDSRDDLLDPGRSSHSSPVKRRGHFKAFSAAQISVP